jgi:hypothetical protein
MSDSNNKLDQLIESTRQDALAQQARSDAQVNQHVAVPRGKQILAAVLMAVCAVVLFYQYPRFSEPYPWPDPSTNPSAAEGELITVVGLIEAYRISQGQYPAVLSQIAIPEGLTALMAETVLVYRPVEQAYTLDWTLPHWHATYDSLSEKVVIEPVGKK